MPKLTICKGLPGSGKTTWAKEYQAHHPGTKRVNRDDLRAMLDRGEWSKENESRVVEIRNDIITKLLRVGYDVICDDTNLSPKVQKQLTELATSCNVEAYFKDFTNERLEDCIYRDMLRAYPVGETVIRDMYEKHLKPKARPIDSVANPASNPYDPALPYAIICDMDGTLALRGDRNWFEWSKVGRDHLNAPVARVLDVFKHGTGTHVIITSGRKEVCRKETLDWIRSHALPDPYVLLMRADDDNRKDDIVKLEMYEQNIKGKFNVRFVLDDRDQVVKMWREQGLPTFQVNYGNF